MARDRGRVGGKRTGDRTVLKPLKAKGFARTIRLHGVKFEEFSLQPPAFHQMSEVPSRD